MANRNRMNRNRDYDYDYDYADRGYYGYYPDRGYYGYDNNRGYYTPYYYDRGYYGNPGYDYYYGYSPYYGGYDFDYGSGYVADNYGQYYGYGPSNYTRSDERIQEDINDRMTWHGNLDATDINVDVKDGVVTLTGSVDSRQDKRLAEDIADSVSGVQDVNNQLSIRKTHAKHGQQGMQGVGQSQVRRGMEVVGSDGRRIGDVKDVRSHDFVVDRSGAPDVYVPFSDSHMTDGQVRVDVRANDIDKQGWQIPETAGSHHGR